MSNDKSKIYDNMLKQKPKDKEHGIQLLHIKEPLRRFEDVILSDDNRSIIDDVIEEHNRQDVLKSYNLSPDNRLLFCGPPGCGKTLSAEVIASELSLPMAIVHIDNVVSPYYGETSSNILQVLDFVSSLPMVALFDEFDCISKERSDASDYVKMKRVINAFLQLLDGYSGKSIIIASTSSGYALEPAVWRQFDDVLFFGNPNLEQLRRLLACKLRGLRRDFDVNNNEIISLFKGMTHADVERILFRAAKDMVLTGKDCLEERHLKSAIRREEARRDRIKLRR